MDDWYDEHEFGDFGFEDGEEWDTNEEYDGYGSDEAPNPPSLHGRSWENKRIYAALSRFDYLIINNAHFRDFANAVLNRDSLTYNDHLGSSRAHPNYRPIDDSALDIVNKAQRIEELSALVPRVKDTDYCLPPPHSLRWPLMPSLRAYLFDYSWIEAEFFDELHYNLLDEFKTLSKVRKSQANHQKKHRKRGKGKKENKRLKVETVDPPAGDAPGPMDVDPVM